MKTQEMELEEKVQNRGNKLQKFLSPISISVEGLLLKLVLIVDTGAAFNLVKARKLHPDTQSLEKINCILSV